MPFSKCLFEGSYNLLSGDLLLVDNLITVDNISRYFILFILAHWEKYAVKL